MHRFFDRPRKFLGCRHRPARHGVTDLLSLPPTGSAAVDAAASASSVACQGSHQLVLVGKARSTVSKLVVRLEGAKQANVSKQLGVLYDAGLLSRRRTGNQIIYAVSEPAIFELCEIVCGKLRREAQASAKLFGTP